MKNYLDRVVSVFFSQDRCHRRATASKLEIISQICAATAALWLSFLNLSSAKLQRGHRRPFPFFNSLEGHLINATLELFNRCAYSRTHNIITHCSRWPAYNRLHWTYSRSIKLFTGCSSLICTTQWQATRLQPRDFIYLRCNASVLCSYYTVL